ncbi:MAG: hypothetical protein HRT47_11970 [Candidatus Caenarcaniphilales bacterium]|nr:hypothetical protein [Candidatus Caenarcaniphilales bacterium]
MSQAISNQVQQLFSEIYPSDRANGFYKWIDLLVKESGDKQRSTFAGDGLKNIPTKEIKEATFKTRNILEQLSGKEYDKQKIGGDEIILEDDMIKLKKANKQKQSALLYENSLVFGLSDENQGNYGKNQMIRVYFDESETDKINKISFVDTSILKEI